MGLPIPSRGVTDMFDRYTERARRVVFFARYEASQLGSRTIETEHLLLGLIREDEDLANRFMRRESRIEHIRKDIESRATIREKVSTAIDLPLSSECMHILAYAAEESERLHHRHIGTEHLLLGILREEGCLASQLLRERGLELNDIRKGMAAQSPVDVPDVDYVPGPDTAIRIAEAVWAAMAIEGLESQKPFQAQLTGELWSVGGTAPEGASKGRVYAVISKRDGRILKAGRGVP